jgi:hypothetical protein
MSPFETICRLYLEHPQEAPFEYYLVWHHRHGFVYSTPGFFIMGRHVSRELFNPNKLEYFSPEDSDAWYVHAMAGSMAKAWSILPWELPYLMWERLTESGRDLRCYPFSDVRRLTDLAGSVVKPTPHEFELTPVA